VVGNDKEGAPSGQKPSHSLVGMLSRSGATEALRETTFMPGIIRCGAYTLQDIQRQRGHSSRNSRMPALMWSSCHGGAKGGTVRNPLTLKVSRPMLWCL
jgi:hypothetical protein